MTFADGGITCLVYGLSLNNANILETIGYSTKNATSTYEVLYNTAIGNMIIVLAGAVPGYWVSVATLDTLGRKTIQLGGFIILTILFAIMGFAYYHISPNGLLAIYVLAQFFFNFGPNVCSISPTLNPLQGSSTSRLVLGGNTQDVLGTYANLLYQMTTFIVPGEVFPTRYRSTSHGISAASGKIGSIIGQGAISTLKSRGAKNPGDSPWMDHVLEIYALFMLLGCGTTFLIPETKRKTLEELSGEDQPLPHAGHLDGEGHKETTTESL